jgi:hypothetical protein
MGFRKDYHGGRTYAADPPDEKTGFAAWLMSKLRSIYPPSSAARVIKLPSAGEDRPTFSRLGDGGQDPNPRHSGRPVFPMADWAARPSMSLRHRRLAASSDAAVTEENHAGR